MGIAAGGQEQHRRVDAVLAQAGTQLQSAQAWQHHIQHQKIVFRCARARQPVLAVVDRLCGIAFGPQVLRHAARQRQVVFNHKNAMGP